MADEHSDNQSSGGEWKTTIAALLLVASGGSAAIAGFWWATDPDPGTADERVLRKARQFYDRRPYYQQPRPHTETPDGLPDIRAKTCGKCHTEIYEEWRISTHRRAWTQDPQFQAELKKSRAPDNPDSDMGWMCVNCHTPVTNQLEKLVVGLEDGDISKPIYRDNPSFDPALQQEAITCATCHVRNATVYGPYGDTDAPHPVERDADLTTEQICVSCHNAEASWPSKNLACFFSTGAEWQKSVYARRGETCQSCHMPQVDRKLAANYDRPERTTRRHWFGGSLLAKHPRWSEQLEKLEPVYGSGVEIELLEASDDAEPNADRSPEFEGDSTRCEADEACTRLWVRLTNSNAGHNMPTGDPERHVDVVAHAFAPSGKKLAVARDRIASRYEWWPEIELQYNNRIPAGGTHDILLEVPTSAPFEVRIEADKYRMYPEAFEHHDLEGRYVRGRNFHRSHWTVDEDHTPSLQTITDDSGTRTSLEPPENR